MKIEIDLPDEEYKKLKEIYKIFDKDINESIEYLTINLIKDSLTKIKSLIYISLFLLIFFLQTR